MRVTRALRERGTLHAMDESGAHANAWLKRCGLIAGPVLAAVVYLAMRSASGGGGGGVSVGGVGGGGASAPATLHPLAPAAGAVAALMGTWWITEALPLAATALIPMAVFPLLGVLPMKAAAAPYADPIVFLFLGGFFIQRAMERWGLHTRLSLLIMRSAGGSPGGLIAGVMGATAFISLWISNAATAAMMLPIAVSLAQAFERALNAPFGPGTGESSARPSHPPYAVRNFGLALMLGVAYAATIGGLGTPIGTAPNMLLLGAMNKQGVGVPFGQWMLIHIPLVIALLAFTWVLVVKVLHPTHVRRVPGGREMIEKQLRDLGPMSRGEWSVLIVFLGAAALWISREPLCAALGLMDGKEAHLTDGGVAILAGLALFVIPVNWRRGEFVLNWEWASKINYGVLLLFGGGLSLAEAISKTQIDAAMGSALGGLHGLSPLVLVLIVTTCTVFLSELVSNTALVATLLPASVAAASALHVHPLLVCLPMALGASTAFMMPAGTPPSAIVFSSGYLSIPLMARAGIFLNIASIVLVTLTAYYLAPVVMGVDLLTPLAAPPPSPAP